MRTTDGFVLSLGVSVPCPQIYATLLRFCFLSPSTCTRFRLSTPCWSKKCGCRTCSKLKNRDMFGACRSSSVPKCHCFSEARGGGRNTHGQNNKYLYRRRYTHILSPFLEEPQRLFLRQPADCAYPEGAQKRHVGGHS